MGDAGDMYEQVERFGNVRRVEPLNFWGVDSAPEWDQGESSSLEIQRQRD